MKKNLVNKLYRRLMAIIMSAASVVTMINIGNPIDTKAIDGSNESTAYTEEYQQVLDELVMLVNEARTEAGLKPLYEVPVLNEASLERSQETVTLFSHSRTDSSMFNTVLDEYQISYNAAAENLAAGSPTAEETFEQWKESPSHWKSIMNPKYTHIGVSMYYDETSYYGWYWQQLFIASDEELEGQYIPEKEVIVPSCCGDVDGDGYITTLDLNLIIKHLLKEVILSDLQVESADCLQDGAITIADAVVMKKYILGVYTSLPRTP